jgi:hypothetical protein
MPPVPKVDEFDRVIKELGDYLEEAKARRQQLVEAEARLDRRRRVKVRGGRRLTDKSVP